MSKMERFKYLLGLYESNTIGVDEHYELFELISTNEYDNLLNEAILSDLIIRNQDERADLPPHIAHEIVRNIYDAEKNIIKVLPTKRKLTKIFKWAVAASVIFIIAISACLFSNSSQNETKKFLSIIPKNTTSISNIGKNEEVIVLNDGSKVMLQPNSSIHYGRVFAGDTREVYLEGDAFFQVAKNPSKPFLVYYNNIVTKVLGTSFRISTNTQTGKIEVAVRTGKVQVFENENMLDLSHLVAKASTILTPNQKAIYDANSHLFENSIVDKPLKLLQNDTAVAVKEVFAFDQEKLSKVFQHIQAYFGIEIIVETSNLYNCVFTGDISNLDMFTAIQTICIATNSTYEVEGTKVLIKGKGCN